MAALLPFSMRQRLGGLIMLDCIRCGNNKPYAQTMLLTRIVLSCVGVRSCLSLLQRSWLEGSEGVLPAFLCSGKGSVAGRSFSIQRANVSPTMLLSTPCSIPSTLSLHLIAADVPPPRESTAGTVFT